eukprot:1182863-Prorocentrum_minimum.AAC.3
MTHQRGEVDAGGAVEFDAQRLRAHVVQEEGVHLHHVLDCHVVAGGQPRHHRRRLRVVLEEVEREEGGRVLLPERRSLQRGARQGHLEEGLALRQPRPLQVRVRRPGGAVAGGAHGPPRPPPAEHALVLRLQFSELLRTAVQLAVLRVHPLAQLPLRHPRPRPHLLQLLQDPRSKPVVNDKTSSTGVDRKSIYYSISDDQRRRHRAPTLNLLT